MNQYGSQLILLISLAICGQAIESRLIESNQIDLRSTVASQDSSSQYSDSGLIQDKINDLPIKGAVSFRKHKFCGRNDNCSLKDPKHKQMPLYSTILQKIWGSNMCFCDDKCFEYGDCCVSKVISQPNMIEVRKNPLLGCIAIDKNYGVIGLTGCEKVDNKLSKLCAKTNITDVYSDIAVFSKSTGTVYGNVYCALCHSVKPPDIVFSNNSINCEQHVNCQLSNGLDARCLYWVQFLKGLDAKRLYLTAFKIFTKVWIQDIGNGSHLRYLQWFGYKILVMDYFQDIYSGLDAWFNTPPSFLQLDQLDYKNGQWYLKKNISEVNCQPFTNIPKCTLIQEGFPNETRICFSRLIDSCPSSRDDLKQACKSYSQPVDHSNITRYKNPHCALCHGEDIKSLTCAIPKTGKRASLGSLLDFDWDFKTCQWPHTIWDGMTQTCLPLDCQSDTCTIAQTNNNLQASKEKLLTHEDIEIYLTFVVIIISTILLLFHNLIYYLQPKRQNVPSRILKNLSWSIIFGHISFLLIDIKFSVPLSICKFIGLSTQFFYSASFFWMNVMSYDVWRTFSKVSLRGSSSSTVKKYSLYAWGCSSLIVSLTMLSDLTQILPDNFQPHIGLYKLCWFSDKLVLAIYFFLPIFTILLLNLYFFGKTVLWFQKQTSKEFERVNNVATGRKEYRKLWLYVKLSVIMGLTWLFCLVSALTKMQFFRYIFIICNGLQGAMIFIMFDMKRTTLYQIVDSFKSRTSWTSNSSDSKHLQGGETTSTNISRNLNSTSLKFNSNKK